MYIVGNKFDFPKENRFEKSEESPPKNCGMFLKKNTKAETLVLEYEPKELRF